MVVVKKDKQDWEEKFWPISLSHGWGKGVGRREGWEEGTVGMDVDVDDDWEEVGVLVSESSDDAMRVETGSPPGLMTGATETLTLSVSTCRLSTFWLRLLWGA